MIEASTPDKIEVHILCIAGEPDGQENEDDKQVVMFRELNLPVPKDLEERVAKRKKETAHEWRPGCIMTWNIECYYPDMGGEHTVIQMNSGSALTVKQHYTEIKALMQGGMYASS